MKKIQLIIFLLSIQYLVIGQVDPKIDLIKFESSECLEEDNVYSIQNRIVSIDYTDSLTFIEIAVITNCCDGETGEIKYSNDTISLHYPSKAIPILNELGDTIEIMFEFCDCDCCFHFKYYIKGLKDKNYILKANGKQIGFSEYKYKVKQEPEYDIVNDDTINYVDIFGFKQGIHLLKNKEGKLIAKMQYDDNKATNGLYKRYFYDSGEIKLELFMVNGEYSKEIEYHKNGKIKKECEIIKLFDDNAKCREYDEQGNQIIK